MIATTITQTIYNRIFSFNTCYESTYLNLRNYGAMIANNLYVKV